MLRIDRAIRDAIVEHARRDHPDEACGVIAGPAGTDRAARFIPMTNAERSPTFYRFDSLEQLRVWREMDERDEEPVVIYHSHTATEAYPSRTDTGLAGEPGAHYVLVSTRDPHTVEFRSFRIVDGQVSEEPVQIEETESMAIEVRIPTILRGHTGGAKSVEGAGETLAELFADLDGRYPGLRARLVTEDAALHRFINVYVNDEDVRFTGALDTKLADGDSVTILPAVAGG